VVSGSPRCVVHAPADANHTRTSAEILARFKHIITTADIPDAVAVVLTCGSLNMINKVDEDINARARQEGKTPLYRPVNAGTNILKQALNDAAQTKSGVKAKKSTLPVQLGLGVKNGPERMTWAIFAAQEDIRRKRAPSCS